MKNKTTYFLIIQFFFLIAIGCKNEKIEPVIFKVSGNLKACFSFKLDSIQRDYKIDIFDTIIIAANSTGPKFLSFYNRNTGKLIKKAVLKGNGPNELLYLSEMKIDANKGLIYLLDGTKEKLVALDIDSLILSNYHCFVIDVNMPLSGLCYSAFQLDEEDSFVAITPVRNKLFIFFDTDGGSVRENGSYPRTRNFKGKVIDEFYGNMWFGRYDINLHRKKIVAGLIFFPKLSIYGLDGEEQKSIYFDTYQPPKFTSVGGAPAPANNTVINYISIHTTDKFIYAAYCGELYGEEKYVNTSNEIHVYTWDGDPVKKMFLDNRISDFCVDEINGVIYGINYELDDQIFEFKYKIE